jgi:hypothetical protein
MQAIFLKLPSHRCLRLGRPRASSTASTKNHRLQLGRSRASRKTSRARAGRHLLAPHLLLPAGRRIMPLLRAGRGRHRQPLRLQRPLPMQGAGRPLPQARRGRHLLVPHPLLQAKRGIMPLPRAGRGRHQQFLRAPYMVILALPPRATSVVPRAPGLRTHYKKDVNRRSDAAKTKEMKEQRGKRRRNTSP